MYHFTIKSFPCEYEAEVLFGLFGESVQFNLKTHGNFSWFTYNDTHILCRPDLVYNETICLGFSDSNKTCEQTEALTIPGSDGEGDAPNKEEVVFNGHKCFKYFDDELMSAFWVDQDGTIWGYSVDASPYLMLMVNYTYLKQSFTPDFFTLPSDVSCEAFPKALTPPDEEVYSEKCPMNTASSASVSYALLLLAVVASLLIF